MNAGKDREQVSRTWLRRFSKLVCGATFFLIFAGGMVTSTGSGLAVPDWPLSYGMLFPPMVGGVFYEHGHRMVAAAVGLLTLALAVWVGTTERRRWARNLAYAALGVVILQGVLGGITVLFFLPTPVSVGHALLAQTFLVIIIVLAYALSHERAAREAGSGAVHPALSRWAVAVFGLIYLQLFIGAWMRHTGSGLAIPDFPLAAGHVIPPFDEEMLRAINDWRFMENYEDVTMGQVAVHFAHRVGAFVVAAALAGLSWVTAKTARRRTIRSSVLVLDALLVAQVTLGAITVWSQKHPVLTSLHVLMGAVMLGASALLVLRAVPVTLGSRHVVPTNPALKPARGIG